MGKNEMLTSEVKDCIADKNNDFNTPQGEEKNFTMETVPIGLSGSKKVFDLRQFNESVDRYKNDRSKIIGECVEGLDAVNIPMLSNDYSAIPINLNGKFETEEQFRLFLKEGGVGLVLPKIQYLLMFHINQWLDNGEIILTSGGKIFLNDSESKQLSSMEKTLTRQIKKFKIINDPLVVGIHTDIRNLQGIEEISSTIQDNIAHYNNDKGMNFSLDSLSESDYTEYADWLKTEKKISPDGYNLLQEMIRMSRPIYERYGKVIEK